MNVTFFPAKLIQLWNDGVFVEPTQRGLTAFVFGVDITQTPQGFSLKGFNFAFGRFIWAHEVNADASVIGFVDVKVIIGVLTKFVKQIANQVIAVLVFGNGFE